MSAYDHPHLFASLDSLEGVPDIFEPRVAPAEKTKGGRAIHDVLEWVGVILPGIGLAFGLAFLGDRMSEWARLLINASAGMHYEKSPISPIDELEAIGSADVAGDKRDGEDGGEESGNGEQNPSADGVEGLQLIVRPQRTPAAV